MRSICQSLLGKLFGISILISLILISGCKIKEKPPEIPPELPTKENPAIASGILRAQKIQDKSQLCFGVWANGYLGDYILENDKIRVIISAPEHLIPNIKGGGHIIDLCLKSYVYDYIRGIYTRVGDSFIPNYTYDDVQIKTTGYPENGAAIIVSGKSDPRQESMLIKTEYLLKPDTNVLEITTSVTNLTTRTLEATPLGDIADWGICTSFVGNQGAIQRNKPKQLENVDWFCGYMDNFSVGFTQKQATIEGYFQEYKSVVHYKKTRIRPGKSVDYKRYLIVADKRLAKISDFVFGMREEKFGFVNGRVVEPDSGEPIPDVDVQFIISARGESHVTPRPFTRTFSDEKGSFEAMLPVGSYFVRSKAFARRSDKRPFSFPIRDGDSYGLEIRVSRTSKLGFSCRDYDTGELMPCKLTFINIPPTPYVNKGPGTELYSRNVYYSATGDETIDLPVGRYKVIFSRGIEYDTYEEEILITYTRKNVIDAKLKHLLDVENHIAADIGVRTNRSYDCYVSPADRVVTAAAEGVEYLVTADSNQAVDLSPDLEELNLGRYLKTAVGKKIEFMGEKNPGHFMVWPLDGADPATLGDNSVLEAETPKQAIEILRSQFPGAFIQVNRAIFPFEGYFSQYGYDHKENPVIEDKDFSYDFDLLEIWEGKRQGIVPDNVNVLFDSWLAGNSHILPMADSSSHRTWGEEVGYPRVYISTSTDDPTRISNQEIMESIKKGHFQITNGPIITFTVNGQPPGSLITDTDGEVDCHLEVRAAPWIPTSYIDVNMDGIFLRRIIQPPSSEVLRFPRKTSSKGSEDFNIKIKKDSLLNVEVVGSERSTLAPVVPPYPFQTTGMMAFAITTPVIIDFDGNGKYDPPPPDQVGM